MRAPTTEQLPDLIDQVSNPELAFRSLTYSLQKNATGSKCDGIMRRELGWHSLKKYHAARVRTGGGLSAVVAVPGRDHVNRAVNSTAFKHISRWRVE